MTASREFNFEAFAAKFEASFTEIPNRRSIDYKTKPPISQRLHWHQQKNILRDLNNSGMAATSPHPSSTGQAALRIDFGGDAWMDQEFSVFQNKGFLFVLAPFIQVTTS